MSEYGSSYIPVRANVATLANEGASVKPDTGYEITGHHVNWSSDGGVTGGGWGNLINAPHSPFYGMTEEDILAEIQNSPDHSLNSIFAKLANLSNREQDAFIDSLVGSYGYTDEGGCIGDRLY